MVKHPRRLDRCFPAAAVQVRFPTPGGPTPPPLAQQASGRRRAGPGSPGGRSQDRDHAAPKRPRAGGSEDARRRQQHPASCAQTGSGSGLAGGAHLLDQQEDDSRAAELQAVGSLKVTIQRSSESREFGATERQWAGLHCHVCNLTCCTPQMFQEHMTGLEHHEQMKKITHCISLSTHTQQSRGRQAEPRRWCDTCQSHFSGDIIVHRQTRTHKACKRQGRPFCPACQRHFRSPRKFVEHMKSAEHKQQVQQDEAQEEELITVDAVGCFEEEEEVDVGEEEEEAEPSGGSQVQSAPGYDPAATYGSTFIVPASGFLCTLCNKFFHREDTARHTHCRTHTHYLRLQMFLQQSDGRSLEEPLS